MRDEPRQIAAWLVQEHGLEEARRVALASSMRAQDEGDNYALSVWREVKRILAGHSAPETETLA